MSRSLLNLLIMEQARWTSVLAGVARRQRTNESFDSLWPRRYFAT
jgi:hypothetical protein